MSKADTLRFRDVRDAYRLIGECRDQGADPALWQRHMLAGLHRLLDVTQAAGGEGHWPRPRKIMRALSVFDVTDDSTSHAALIAYHRARGPATDPLYRALARIGGGHVTRTRRQLVSDAEWLRSETYQAFRRPSRIVHEIASVFATSHDGVVTVIALNRAGRARDFSPREQRLLHFFHGEVGRLIPMALTSVAEPGPNGLSPRLGQTLSCLLDGDTEKQVAARLGLSPATVHQYVTALYRRFGVRSRSQLLVHALKRRHDERWSRLFAGR